MGRERWPEFTAQMRRLTGPPRFVNQRAAAAALRISPDRLHRWLNGAVPRDARTLFVLARRLGVPAAWLLLGVDGVVDLRAYERTYANPKMKEPDERRRLDFVAYEDAQLRGERPIGARPRPEPEPADRAQEQWRVTDSDSERTPREKRS